MMTAGGLLSKPSNNIIEIENQDPHNIMINGKAVSMRDHAFFYKETGKPINFHKEFDFAIRHFVKNKKDSVNLDKKLYTPKKNMNHNDIVSHAMSKVENLIHQIPSKTEIKTNSEVVKSFSSGERYSRTPDKNLITFSYKYFPKKSQETNITFRSESLEDYKINSSVKIQKVLQKSLKERVQILSNKNKVNHMSKLRKDLVSKNKNISKTQILSKEKIVK